MDPADRATFRHHRRDDRRAAPPAARRGVRTRAAHLVPDAVLDQFAIVGEPRTAWSTSCATPRRGAAGGARLRDARRTRSTTWPTSPTWRPLPAARSPTDRSSPARSTPMAWISTIATRRRRGPSQGGLRLGRRRGSGSRASSRSCGSLTPGRLRPHPPRAVQGRARTSRVALTPRRKNLIGHVVLGAQRDALLRARRGERCRELGVDDERTRPHRARRLRPCSTIADAGDPPLRRQASRRIPARSTQADIDADARAPGLDDLDILHVNNQTAAPQLHRTGPPTGSGCCTRSTPTPTTRSRPSRSDARRRSSPSRRRTPIRTFAPPQVQPSGPYWNQARYVPEGAAPPAGHLLVAPGAPAWVRRDTGVPCGLVPAWRCRVHRRRRRARAHHAPFLAAARAVHGGSHVVPLLVHVNLNAPGPTTDPLATFFALRPRCSADSTTAAHRDGCCTASLAPAWRRR